MERKIDRFDKYMKYRGLNDNQVTVQLSLSVGIIGKSRKENRDLSNSVIEKVLNFYTDLDRNWLLTGEGEMLKHGTTEPCNPNQNGIPLVTQSAVAGFGNIDFMIEEADVKAYYVIPKFSHCKVDFMIEISGSSMYPKYNSGDVVACTILHEHSFIQWNKCHVIATREQGILCKRLRQSQTEGYIMAVSDNENYPPFDIPVAEITGIALVVGVIRLE